MVACGQQQRTLLLRFVYINGLVTEILCLLQYHNQKFWVRIKLHTYCQQNCHALHTITDSPPYSTNDKTTL